MSNAKEELIEKLNTLSLDELIKYRSTAKMTNRIIDILGISTIFLMILITNAFVITIGGIVVFLMSYVSVGMNNITRIIQERLETRFPDK